MKTPQGSCSQDYVSHNCYLLKGNINENLKIICIILVKHITDMNRSCEFLDKLLTS